MTPEDLEAHINAGLYIAAISRAQAAAAEAERGDGVAEFVKVVRDPAFDAQQQYRVESCLVQFSIVTRGGRNTSAVVPLAATTSKMVRDIFEAAATAEYAPAPPAGK